MNNDFIDGLAQAKSDKLDSLIQSLDTVPVNDDVEDDWWASSY